MKHLVMQDKLVRIGPVIWNVSAIVITHYAWRVPHSNESIHLTAIYIRDSTVCEMRVIAIHVVLIVEGLHTIARPRIRNAYSELAVLLRNAFGSWKRTEIRIE